jgi:phosphoribosylanthranilate isomerase
VKVKICGVTTVEDALMSAGAGADLIGLNFYPASPRYLSRVQAAEIAAAVRARPDPPALVAVFVNETAGTMLQVLEACRLDLAQLSGDETGAVVEAMGERGFKAIRTYPPEVAQDTLLLLDAHAAGQYGGTGKTADWERAAELARRCRLLLAGGLTPDNVAAAVARVRPWGVDVASGVESAPGVKDRSKVDAFILNARRAAGLPR